MREMEIDAPMNHVAPVCLCAAAHHLPRGVGPCAQAQSPWLFRLAATSIPGQM